MTMDFRALFCDNGERLDGLEHFTQRLMRWAGCHRQNEIPLRIEKCDPSQKAGIDNE